MDHFNTSMRESPSLFAAKVLKVELHETQALFVDASARVKVASCGRRWGKSFAEAVQLLHFAIAHPGSSQFVIAPTADQASIIMTYVESLIRGAPALCDADSIRVVRSPFWRIDIGDSSLHARSGGDSGRNVRGHGADRIIFDEAAYIPDDVYAAVSPLLASSAIAERVLISTPFGHNFFFDQFTLGESCADGYRAFRFPSSSNPHLSRSYLEQEQASSTSVQWAVEYEGVFREDQNAVFPWPLIQSCIDTEIESSPVAGHRYVIGFDPAKWQDRSAVVVLDVTSEPYRAVSITDISGRDYLVQAEHIRSIAREHFGARVLIDATSHDQMLEQLRKDDVQATGFKFTNESKQELINGLVIAMEQGRIAIPSNPLLLEEMKYYRYELTASGNVKLGADARHHDDLVTALALALHCVGSVAPIISPGSMTKQSTWTSIGRNPYE